MNDKDGNDDVLVPAKRQKTTPMAAIQLLVASVATMTRAEVQVEWTKLCGETRRPGGKNVQGVGLLQEALRKRNLGVCTTCNTVKTVGEMDTCNNHCKLCNPRRKTGKALRAEKNRRVMRERASCVQNKVYP